MPKKTYRLNNREKLRQKANAFYAQNTEAKKRYSKAAADKFYTWLVAQKCKPCLDCGQQFPACVMDFDHRPGEQKRFSVGAGKNKSLETLLAEIAKCDLVCANCHRLRTFYRGQYKRIG